MYLLAICISSLEKYRSFAHFLTGLFVFLVLIACAACVFWRLILCQLLHVLLFSPTLSHSEGCLFTLLIVFFFMQKLLSLIRSHLFIFAFISSILGGGS